MTQIIDKEENGKHISPVFSDDGIKNYLIDIDGTICDDIPNEEPERMSTATVFPDALEILNKWHDEGHIITFFTSRTESHRIVTKKWLADNGFKYHGIIFGKPRFGNYIWVDNHKVKGVTFKGIWSDLIPVMKTINIFREE